MITNSLIYLFTGALASTIGAIPFGLVNLTVVNVAVNTNIRKAMKVAHGAAVIEILFAITAVLAGTLFKNTVTENSWVKFGVITVLLVSGFIFWFKKNKTAAQKNDQNSFGFLKGALLNLMSLQVFLFWIVSVTFLSVKNLLPGSLVQITLFISGVWSAKMLILRAYAILGQSMVGKSEFVSKNINRIISLMLLLVAIIQFAEM